MNKGLIILIYVIFFVLSDVNGQEVVRLWKSSAPTDNKIIKAEEWSEDKTWVVDVSIPELHIYKAEKPNGAAIVICPGGGYAGLAMAHEGKAVAEWLADRGFTAVVLKYRMPNKNSAVSLEDGHQAMRYVRENANKLGVNPNRIGVLGFSAGGHLASTISTHYAVEGTSTRPDFSILFYPVITMKEATHGGSKENLLGDNPSMSDIHRFSTEEQVSVNTPPTILLLSDDDETVSTWNSEQYYAALKRNDIPAAMYIFPEGGHGWGFRENFKYHDVMKSLLEAWLHDVIK